MIHSFVRHFMNFILTRPWSGISWMSWMILSYTAQQMGIIKRCAGLSEPEQTSKMDFLWNS